MTARVRPTFARKLVVGVSLLAAAIGLASAWRGIPDLATHVRDDAFHEFAWARNLAQGLGPSVGAGISTSGVQPLWSLLLALVACFTDQLPSVAPALGFACHLVAAWLLRREGRGTWIGNAAMLLWLGNPMLLRECQNGQETALACLCAVMLWRARRAGAKRFCLVAAAATLARADLLLLALLLAVARRTERPSVRAGMAAIAIVPWLLFQRVCGGSWLPDSAAPMAWLAHANFERLAPSAAEWWMQQWRYARPALLGAPFWNASLAAFGALVASAAPPLRSRAVRLAPLVACGVAACLGASDLGTAAVAAALLATASLRTGPHASARRFLLALTVALVGIVVVHDFVRWHPRDYYFAPLALGGVAGFLALRKRPVAALLLATAQLAHVATVSMPLEPLGHQRTMQGMGASLVPLLGDGARVGCFNSGLVSWEQLRHGSSGAQVVNLDGVVNARAFAALQQARLSAYLDDERVRFVCDQPVQWSMDASLPHASGAWFDGGRDPGPDLVELARCVVPGVAGDRPGADAFVLCWRRGRGEPPTLPDRTQWIARTSDGSPVLWFVGKRGDGLDIEAGEREPWFTAAHDGNYLLPMKVGAEGRVYVRGQTRPIAPSLLR